MMLAAPRVEERVDDDENAGLLYQPTPPRGSVLAPPHRGTVEVVLGAFPVAVYAFL